MKAKMAAEKIAEAKTAQLQLEDELARKEQERLAALEEIQRRTSLRMSESQRPNPRATAISRRRAAAERALLTNKIARPGGRTVMPDNTQILAAQLLRARAQVEARAQNQHKSDPRRLF